MPELKRPFVMLYSRAIGIETQAHIGHTIRRADSDRPEGPFVDSGHVLTPDIDFAIDTRTCIGCQTVHYASRTPLIS